MTSRGVVREQPVVAPQAHVEESPGSVRPGAGQAPNLAPAIYGTVAVGSVLAVESAQRETYLETVGAVLIALVLYWLAHSYAEFASRRLQWSQPITLAGLRQTMASELSILAGAALPIVVLLVSWAAGARLARGVTAAIWTSAVMIVTVEIVAGVRAKQSGRHLARQVGVGALLGVLIIALRVTLH
ncbi:MAG: hypothetical protein ACLPTJ_14980 [Solirubrobacteraceae bacterium]